MLSKDTTTKIKKQVDKNKKISAKYIGDKGILYIERELKLNYKTIMGCRSEETLHKDILMANKQIKRCSALLTIRE